MFRRQDLRFDPDAIKGGAVNGGRGVIAQFADITCLQAPGLAGDYSGSGLTAGQDLHRLKLDLCAARWKPVKGDQSVRRV